MGLFGKKKKSLQENAETIAINNSVSQSTKAAIKRFTKPAYSPETRRTVYNDPNALKAAKDRAFAKGPVTDPYTKQELVKTRAEARQKYGADYQRHLAEADHIDTMSPGIKRIINDPWSKTRDIKCAFNRDSNFQMLSRTNNQTGGKGGMSQEEWSRDAEKMAKLSQESGISSQELSDHIRQVGQKAKLETDLYLARARIKNIADTSVQAGTAAGINAGGTAATISGVYNIIACLRGEKSISDAMRDIGDNSLDAGVKGCLVGAGTTVINNTLAASQNELISALGKQNALGTALAAVTVTGDTLMKWSTGEISSQECVLDLGEKGFGYGGSIYGAAVGQALIPIPIVGSAIGCMVGGQISGTVIHTIRTSLEDALEERRREHEKLVQEMMRYYAEVKRREEVKALIHTTTVEAARNAISTIANSDALKNLVKELSLTLEDEIQTRMLVAQHVEAALQLQEYRRQLQEYMNQYFSGYEKCFGEALNIMDTALKMEDYEGAMVGTNKVARLFGKAPVVENTQEFIDKMFGDGIIEF